MYYVTFINFIADNLAVYMWCITALFFLLLEMGNPGLLFFIAFSFGAAAAAIVSFFDGGLMQQLLAFFSCTIGGMILLRSLVRAYWSKTSTSERTNVYALKGKHGFVLRVITLKEPGLVTVGGEHWIAFSVHGHTIPEGNKIEIIDIKGSHLIVKSIDNIT